MSSLDDLKYVVLHNHPDGLEMNQLQRDLLFATGNVLSVKECSLHSLQPQFFKNITRRPLAIVLWGMADRYGVAETEDVEIFQADSWGDAHNYCQGYRPYADTWTDDQGRTHNDTHWKRDV